MAVQRGITRLPQLRDFVDMADAWAIAAHHLRPEANCKKPIKFTETGPDGPKISHF